MWKNKKYQPRSRNSSRKYSNNRKRKNRIVKQQSRDVLENRRIDATYSESQDSPSPKSIRKVVNQEEEKYPSNLLDMNVEDEQEMDSSIPDHCWVGEYLDEDGYDCDLLPIYHDKSANELLQNTRSSVDLSKPYEPTHTKVEDSYFTRRISIMDVLSAPVTSSIHAHKNFESHENIDESQDNENEDPIIPALDSYNDFHAPIENERDDSQVPTPIPPKVCFDYGHRSKPKTQPLDESQLKNQGRFKDHTTPDKTPRYISPKSCKSTESKSPSDKQPESSIRISNMDILHKTPDESLRSIEVSCEKIKMKESVIERSTSSLPRKSILKRPRPSLDASTKNLQPFSHKNKHDVMATSRRSDSNIKKKSSPPKPISKQEETLPANVSRISVLSGTRRDPEENQTLFSYSNVSRSNANSNENYIPVPAVTSYNIETRISAERSILAPPKSQYATDKSPKSMLFEEATPKVFENKEHLKIKPDFHRVKKNVISAQHSPAVTTVSVKAITTMPDTNYHRNISSGNFSDTRKVLLDDNKKRFQEVSNQHREEIKSPAEGQRYSPQFNQTTKDKHEWNLFPQASKYQQGDSDMDIEESDGQSAADESNNGFPFKQIDDEESFDEQSEGSDSHLLPKYSKTVLSNYDRSATDPRKRKARTNDGRQNLVQNITRESLPNRKDKISGERGTSRSRRKDIRSISNVEEKYRQTLEYRQSNKREKESYRRSSRESSQGAEQKMVPEKHSKKHHVLGKSTHLRGSSSEKNLSQEARILDRNSKRKRSSEKSSFRESSCENYHRGNRKENTREFLSHGKSRSSSRGRDIHLVENERREETDQRDETVETKRSVEVQPEDPHLHQTSSKSRYKSEYSASHAGQFSSLITVTEKQRELERNVFENKRIVEHQQDNVDGVERKVIICEKPSSIQLDFKEEFQRSSNNGKIEIFSNKTSKLPEVGPSTGKINQQSVNKNADLLVSPTTTNTTSRDKHNVTSEDENEVADKTPPRRLINRNNFKVDGHKKPESRKQALESEFNNASYVRHCANITPDKTQHTSVSVDASKKAAPADTRLIITTENVDSNRREALVQEKPWLRGYITWFNKVLLPVLPGGDEKLQELHDPMVFLEKASKGERKCLSYLPRGDDAKEMLRYVSLNKKGTTEEDEGQESDTHASDRAVFKDESKNKLPSNLTSVWVDKNPSAGVSNISQDTTKEECIQRTSIAEENSSRSGNKEPSGEIDVQCEEAPSKICESRPAIKVDEEPVKTEKDQPPPMAGKSKEKTSANPIRGILKNTKPKSILKSSSSSSTNVSGKPANDKPNNDKDMMGKKISEENINKSVKEKTILKSHEKSLSKTVSVRKKEDVKNNSYHSEITKKKNAEKIPSSKPSNSQNVEKGQHSANDMKTSRENENALQDQSFSNQDSTKATDSTEIKKIDETKQCQVEEFSPPNHPQSWTHSAEKTSSRRKPTQRKSSKPNPIKDKEPKEFKPRGYSNSSALRSPTSSKEKEKKVAPERMGIPKTKQSSSMRKKDLRNFQQFVERAINKILNVMFKFEHYAKEKVVRVANDVVYQYQKKYGQKFTLDEAIHEIYLLFQHPTKSLLNEVKRRMEKINMTDPNFNVDEDAYLLFWKGVSQLCKQNLRLGVWYSDQNTNHVSYVRQSVEYLFPQFYGESTTLIKVYLWMKHTINASEKDLKVKDACDKFPERQTKTVEECLKQYVLDEIKKPLYRYSESESCSMIADIVWLYRNRYVKCDVDLVAKDIVKMWILNHFNTLKDVLQFEMEVPQIHEDEIDDMDNLVILDEVYSDNSEDDEDSKKVVYEIDVGCEVSSLSSVQVIDLF